MPLWWHAEAYPQKIIFLLTRSWVKDPSLLEWVPLWSGSKLYPPSIIIGAPAHIINASGITPNLARYLWWLWRKWVLGIGDPTQKQKTKQGKNPKHPHGLHLLLKSHITSFLIPHITSPFKVFGSFL